MEGASIPEPHHHAAAEGDGQEHEGFVVGEVTDHAIDLHDIRPVRLAACSLSCLVVSFPWLDLTSYIACTRCTAHRAR